MAQETTSSNPKSIGRRQLNIVYFIDSAKTRSTSISITKIYATMVAFGLIICWGLASIFFIVKISKNNREIRQNLIYAKQSLFEYQIQYDHVFENAYPVSTHLIADRASDLPSVPIPTLSREPFNTPDIQIAPTWPTNLDQLISPFSKLDFVLQNEIALQLAPKTKKNPPTESSQEVGFNFQNVKLENQHLEVQDKILNLSIDMTNMTQPQKIEGHIWAVAEYTSKDGVKTLVTSPQNLVINPSTGLPKSPKSASLFAIKNFKRKTFQFKIPSNSESGLTKLSVGLIDKTGGMSRTILLPLETEPKVLGPLNF